MLTDQHLKNMAFSRGHVRYGNYTLLKFQLAIILIIGPPDSAYLTPSWDQDPQTTTRNSVFYLITLEFCRLGATIYNYCLHVQRAHKHDHEQPGR